jgi:hypothetical protein
LLFHLISKLYERASLIVATNLSVWVTLRAVAAMHAELIAEHGGLAGLVRIAELEAGLGRPLR